MQDTPGQRHEHTAAARRAQERLKKLVREESGRLLHTRPTFSASRVFGPIQIALIVSLPVALAAGLYLAPADTVIAGSILLGIAFLATTVLRFLAVVTRPPGTLSWKALADNALPVYTVLVPLYREADMVPGLLAALNDIDYPRGRLDIKLILEADDDATRDAVAAHALPAHMSVLALPAEGPRTKPKALSVGLAMAKGTLVCVFDAEDRPEADQLRRAAGAFARAPAGLACVQARLAYRNWNQNWLTRQFGIEYAAQFDVLIPFISRHRLPMPLGGTSNHFDTRILREIGGWDPYNVTEDADLGLRLARCGYTSGAIDSTTFEEAPAQLVDWVRQRSRWIKGWMQTTLVHLRQPVRLARDLGVFGTACFIATVASNVASPLIHPLAICFITLHVYENSLFSAERPAASALAAIAGTNLFAGYAAALAMAVTGIRRRPMGHAILAIVTTPLYWCLALPAFLVAIVDLVRRPHFWAKTPHRPVKNENRAMLRRKSKATPQDAP